MSLDNKYNVLFILLFFLLNIAIFAQNEEIIEIGNLYSGEVDYSTFEILEPSSVNIEGNAGNFGSRFKDNIVFYGWIINSETREIVWDAREDSEFDDKNGMFDFNETIPLDIGKYEVYYSANNSGTSINNFNDLLSKVFSSSRNKFKNRYREELGITVSGEEGKFRVLDSDIVIDEMVENSIVSINRVMDDEDLEVGFSLDGNTKIRIYSIGEGRSKELFDLAWITDVKTNKIVWKASLKKSAHAGGGQKNYLIDDKIELPKGSYMLNYSSDDSHSFEEWNVMPPNDPQFWGVTLWAVSDEDKKNVVSFREEDIIKPLIEMTRVEDDEFLSKGFSLKHSAKLRILCVGEGYDKDDLADYGWIVNADTKEVVWSMNDNNLIEHAGGAKKNRMVDEDITLEKGNYIAHYLSDDSHSYEEWNASDPFNRSSWGLTIWSDEKNIDFFDAKNYRSQNIITEIVRVGDDEELQKAFTISRDSKVRILAIGEGERSGMDDYGWIEDSDGDIVWEMRYRRTDKAGGASKNRIFSGTINLESGKYTLHFRTDDSHSYDSWNSSPPENQDNYGITLFLEK